MVATDRPPRILIVEDEPALADSVRYVLEMEGFEVAIAENGRAGLEEARQGPVNLVLLDLMLPELSGLDVCRHIRAISDVPIIVLTAKDSEADKVAGLELGADDYVTKPFSMRELVSRVRAALRRYDMADTRAVYGGEVLRAATVEMDIDRHEVRVGGSLVPLRPKEFELLEALIRRKDKLATARRPHRRSLGSALLRRYQDPGRTHQATPPEARARSTPTGVDHHRPRAGVQADRCLKASGLAAPRRLADVSSPGTPSPSSWSSSAWVSA